MHQYCLLCCACYIINTHTDMTWIWYDKSIRGEEIEKKLSECIFHELQSSPAKVLDMIFQFQRLKGGTQARQANMWLYENKPGISYAIALIVMCPHLWQHIHRSTLLNLAYRSWLLDQGPVKKSCKCDTTSSDLPASSDVSTSDGLWHCCSYWYLIKVKAGNFKGSIFNFFHNFSWDWWSYK